MNPKLKEFLKPDWKTAVYFIELVLLAAVSTNVLSLDGYDSSCVFARIFEICSYILFFVLGTPAIFMMILVSMLQPILGFLGVVAYIIAIVPEVIYLHALARILSTKLPMRYAAALTAAFLLLIGLNLSSSICPPYSHFGNVDRGVGFTAIKPLDRSIEATPTTLNATFVNAAGTPVNVTTISIGGITCNSVTFGGTTTTASGRVYTLDKPLQLAGGGTARFHCTTTLEKGDGFAATVNFTYTETVAGTTLLRTERGRLTGEVE